MVSLEMVVGAQEGFQAWLQSLLYVCPIETSWEPVLGVGTKQLAADCGDTYLWCQQWGRWKQNDPEFEASKDYTVRSFLR